MKPNTAEAITADPMSEYDYCRVCNTRLPDNLAAFARKRFERTTCSTVCSRKEIVQQHGCCEQAVLRPCVCMYSFDCPTHGVTCIGTHD